jgi:hypothetical protein
VSSIHNFTDSRVEWCPPTPFDTAFYVGLSDFKQENARVASTGGGNEIDVGKNMSFSHYSTSC